MTGCILGIALSLDASSRGREGRIHNDDGGLHVAGQNVVKLLGILGEYPVEAHLFQERCAARRKLVHEDFCACILGEYSKPADARRWLEHYILFKHRLTTQLFRASVLRTCSFLDVRYPGSKVGQGWRRRELLKFVHFLRALGLRRKLGDEVLQLLDFLLGFLDGMVGRIHGEIGCENSLVHAHFHGVISILRSVFALGLRSAECFVGFGEKFLPSEGFLPSDFSFYPGRKSLAGRG